MGHCFTDTVTTLTPFLMLTIGLSATLRQCVRPKHYTETIFRLKISISIGLGCSSIDKIMTRDLRFRPANFTTYQILRSTYQFLSSLNNPLLGDNRIVRSIKTLFLGPNETRKFVNRQIIFVTKLYTKQKFFPLKMHKI